MTRLMARIHTDTSPRWLIKPVLITAAIMWVLAYPDPGIILVWTTFGSIVGLWAIRRSYEPSVADITDTQPIPIIRAVRCPRCGNEQMGPADTVVECTGCSKRMLIPPPGKKTFLTCPTCDYYQEGEEGTWKTCENGCGFRGWISTQKEDDAREDMEAAA